MLQNNYGRLAIVSVFVIIAIILMMAPGMHTKPSNEDQLNFTSMPKENISKNTDQNAKTSVAEAETIIPSSANEKTFSSPEEQMLDAWGMNKTAGHAESEAADSIVPDNRPQSEGLKENIQSSPLSVPDVKENPAAQNQSGQSSAKPNPPQKIVKVGAKCFTASQKAVFMLKPECDKVAVRFGIHSCTASESKDEWAGAVRTCGGVDKLPDMDDLLALAGLIYSNPNIKVAEKDRHLFRAYSNFSTQIPVADNMSFNYLIYSSSKAKTFELPEEPGFSIWGRTEISPEYALALTFKEDAAEYRSDTSRTSENFYTMCQVECSQ